MDFLKRIEKWIIKNKLPAFIILCAIFLRMWRLGEFAMFLADQGRDALIVRKIALFQHLPLIGPPSSIGQVYLGPFFYYLIAPFFYLSSFDPVGLAFGVSFIMTVGIILGYLAVKRTEKKRTALFFLLLTSFSYQLIWFSRFSWNPNLLPVFSFFTLYFLYRFFETKKYIYSMLYGIGFALCFQLHHLAVFLAIPIALSYLYAFFAQKKTLFLISSIAVSFISFLLISSPLIIFDLKHDFLNIKNLHSLLTEQNVIAGGSPMVRLLETNHAFFQTVLQLHYPQAVSTVVSIVLFLSLIVVILKKRNLFIGIHTVNIYSYIYLFSKLSSPRHPHYYGLIYLSLFVVVSYLFDMLPKKLPWIVGSFLCISLYFILNARHYYFIAGKPSNQINHARYVASTIIPHIANKPYNFATYPVEYTSEDTYLYFLEKQGLPVARRELNQVTDQMYVLCNQKPCNVLNSGSWNIEMFGKAKIDTIWSVDGITIYRLIHER
ncbi:MAG: glycosyltransferase family 39 protein [Patescibacteria group bacterium]